MNKERKLILFLCVSIPAFYLIRKLLIVLGLAIVGEVATYLFLGVVGLILVNILVPKEYRAWANLLPILCALIFSVMSIKAGIESHDDENKKAGKNTLTMLKEKSWARAEIILTNRIVDQAAKKLGLSKKKSGQTKKSYFRRTTTSPKRVETSPPGDWGKTIATSTFPEVVNSWSRFAQTEAQKAMQRVANQGKGNRVKIE